LRMRNHNPGFHCWTTIADFVVRIEVGWLAGVEDGARDAEWI